MENFANYEYALVCRDLPKSLVNGLSMDKHDPIDLVAAEDQHTKYLEYLEQSGLKLIEIKAQEEFPDCVFVEDTAIAVDNRIFITNPGALTRRGETQAVLAKFKEHADELGLQLTEVRNKNEAFIEGGDVCYTGREILVGLSERTNQKGADELAEAFTGIPVNTCKVDEGLHLKSAMTMLGPDLILIDSSAAGKSIRKVIEENSPFANCYKFVEAGECGSANVLFFNGRLVYPMRFEKDFMKLEEFKSFKDRVKGLVNDEFVKVDGCLTCRCVFFNKAK